MTDTNRCEPTHRYGFEDTTPTIDPEASVSPAATLIGDVTVQAGASVWPGAVLRGDMNSVYVGPDTHVEDNVTVHMSKIGTRVMVGHGVVIDAATIGDQCLLGNNAAINRGVTVGERSIVAAGAVVPDGREVPPESFVRGIPATVEPLSETSINADRVFKRYSPAVYDDLVSRYDDLFE
jgi:carbonic anhydrase/acetyltransferase-like protein (isoleucine patch superfamily)